MFFERGDDAAKHDAGYVFGGLFDFDDLEAAGESGIFLEVFFVFGPGGGGDGAEFAACERWFEEIGGVVLAFGAACADHGVGFVDEEDDFFGGGFDFVDEALEAVFEFAFDAGSGLKECEVEAVEVDSLECGRDVSQGDAVGESFDYCGLADSSFAGEDGIVLTAAHEDIDHLTDFVIAAENRVDLACFRVGREVDGVLIEEGSFAFGCCGAVSTACSIRG